MTSPQQLAGTAETRAEVAAPAGRPIKVGLNMPTVEGSMGGQSARWKDLLALARRAEAAGFDSLWVPDHLLVRWQEHTRGIWECWSLLAALAAATERVELGPLVTRTGFRSPALIAKMADTVDEISGGRLVLGLGAGTSAPEESAFGAPGDHRVDRFEEALRIIVPLLREGSVDFAGNYYQARDCELRPRGPRPGGPPVMIGAKGPLMLRLAATYADLWDAEGPLRRPADFAPLRAGADAACAEVGRDPATLGRGASVVINLPTGQGGSQEQGGGQPGQASSPEEMAEMLRGYAREGLDHVQVWLTPCTLESLEWFGEALKLLGRTTGESAERKT